MKELLAAIGAITEICAIMRDELMRNGFTREEAVGMATAYLVSSMTPKQEDK